MMVKTMSKIKQYVIGTKNVPYWCKDKLTPYIKMDGSTGYEFRVTEKDFELAKGDRLILHQGQIHIRRKVTT